VTRRSRPGHYAGRPNGIEEFEDPDCLTLDEFRRSRAAEDVRRAEADELAEAEAAHRRAEDLARAHTDPGPEAPFEFTWGPYIAAAWEDRDP
jgi:hypothetical protein